MKNTSRGLPSTAWRALKISFQTKSKISLFISVVGFPMALLPVAISTALGGFTDRVQLLSQQGCSVTAVLMSLLVLLLLYLTQTVYSYWENYYSAVDQHRTAKYIKKTIIDCTSQVEYRYIENEGDFREKLAFAEMFGGARVAQSMQQTIVVLRQLITFVSIICTLSYINLWIVVILLVTCIPSVVLSMLQKDEDYRQKTKSMAAGAMSVHLFYIASGANEHCKSMTDMRFCDAFPWIKNRWREVSEGYVQEKNALSKKHLLYNSMADILRNGVYIGVLLMSAWEIYQNPALGLGSFMLVLTLSGQLQTAATRVFTGASGFLGDLKYMCDFFELSDTPLENREDKPTAPDGYDICLKNVRFSYPGAERPALKNISVTIKQGERVAIVGENGSGKSTFVNLLCGMYAPEHGEITVGGLKVFENLRSVRSAVSVVFQGFGRYEDSIRENITISDVNRKLSDTEILKIVEMSNANELVSSQPSGLDEEVGSFSKSGNNLSGGQWQKLAIARALYRDKAKIMVLDEPTSALDPIAEAKLYCDFAKLTENKTTVLISHRLGVTAVVDRILVFDNGEIIEDGTHDELMALGGQYCKMYTAQAQWYV